MFRSYGSRPVVEYHGAQIEFRTAAEVRQYLESLGCPTSIALPASRRFEARTANAKADAENRAKLARLGTMLNEKRAVNSDDDPDEPQSDEPDDEKQEFDDAWHNTSVACLGCGNLQCGCSSAQTWVNH